MQSKRLMEQSFSAQMGALSSKNAAELLAIDLKSRAKVVTEENRHAVLVRDTEETNRRWGTNSFFHVKSLLVFFSRILTRFPPLFLTCIFFSRYTSLAHISHPIGVNEVSPLHFAVFPSLFTPIYNMYPLTLFLTVTYDIFPPTAVDEENKALVESHQAYLREMTMMYENKLRIEQGIQREAQRAKEQLQVCSND